MNTKYKLPEYCMMMILVSFLGFLVEDIWIGATEGYIDNRNMLLPFLSGYGLAVIGFYIVLGTPGKLRAAEKLDIHINRKWSFVIYFIAAFFLISLCEILLGTFVERRFGFVYWNYSNLPLHLTKYTSVPTSLGFSLILTLFMEYSFTPIMSRIVDMPSWLKTLSVIAAVILLADLVISFGFIYKNRAANFIWRRLVFHL